MFYRDKVASANTSDRMPRGGDNGTDLGTVRTVRTVLIPQPCGLSLTNHNGLNLS